MLQKGLVRREGSNYRAALSLTELGKKAAEQVCQRAALAVDMAGQGFSSEERDVFYHVLETVTANLQELSKTGIPE